MVCQCDKLENSLGVSDFYISHIANGRIDFPRIEQLIKFLAAYGGIKQKSFYERVHNIQNRIAPTEDLLELIPELGQEKINILLSLARALRYVLYIFTMSKPLYIQIREQYQLGPATHITHIQNLNGLITNGLQSHSRMQAGLQYIDLSDQSVQLGREQKTVPATGRGLHEYVPLYFGWKSPMLMSHQDKNEQIIYLRFSLEIQKQPKNV